MDITFVPRLRRSIVFQNESTGFGPWLGNAVPLALGFVLSPVADFKISESNGGPSGPPLLRFKLLKPKSYRLFIGITSRCS
jgi:hypothetical protein